MFKYELHLHTSEVSSCARVSARDIPKLYQDKGYDVIAVTDHYYPHFFERRKTQKWEDAIDAYLQGYYIMANEGLKCGIRVIMGMEITFVGGPEDYLVYGISEEFLKDNPHLYKKNLKQFYKIARKNNLFVAQAHPFRKYIKQADPRFIDGIEVHNGSTKHDSQNDLALKFAEDNKLIKISGSDFHFIEDAARGGVVLDDLADTSEELAQLLLSNGVKEIIRGINT